MADLSAIVEELDGLTISESTELVEILEDKWNVIADPYKDWVEPDPEPEPELEPDPEPEPSVGNLPAEEGGQDSETNDTE